MDAFDFVRSATDLKVHIRGNYEWPPALAAMAPSAVSSHECIVKQSGSLDLSLGARTLGWPAPFDFDVACKNINVLALPGWPPIANWSLGQPIGRDFVTADGRNVRVESVEGHLSSTVVPRATYQSGVGLVYEPPGAPCSGNAPWHDSVVAGFFFLGGRALWTFRVVIDGRPEVVTFTLQAIWFDIAAPETHRVPFLDAIVVQILFGGRLDTSGVGIGGGGKPEPIPPGPLPYRERLNDSLVGLACSQLAWAVADPHARARIQDAALETVRSSVEDMRKEVANAFRGRGSSLK